MPMPFLDGALSRLLDDVEFKSIVRAVKKAKRAGGKVGGGIVIDTRGRKWNPSLHPRDSRGRFIETGGVAKVWGGGRGRVIRSLGNGQVELRMADGKKRTVPASRLTMVSRPNGGRPIKDDGSRKSRALVMAEDVARDKDGKRGDGVKGDDDGDGIPDHFDIDPEGFKDGDEPDWADDGKDDDLADAPQYHGKRRNARPQVIRDEFQSVDEVKAHWKGEDRKHEDPDAPVDPNAAALADRLESAQLSPEGEHLVARVDGQWQVFQTDTGRPVAGHNGSAKLTSKPAALAKAADLDDVYDPDAPKRATPVKGAVKVPRGHRNGGHGYSIKDVQPPKHEGERGEKQIELYDSKGELVASTTSRIDTKPGQAAGWRGEALGFDIKASNEAEFLEKAKQIDQAAKAERDPAVIERMADQWWNMSVSTNGGDVKKAARAVRAWVSQKRKNGKGAQTTPMGRRDEKVNKALEARASAAEKGQPIPTAAPRPAAAPRAEVAPKPAQAVPATPAPAATPDAPQAPQQPRVAAADVQRPDVINADAPESTDEKLDRLTEKVDELSAKIDDANAPDAAAKKSPLPEETDDVIADVRAFEKWATDNNYDAQPLVDALDKDENDRRGLYTALDAMQADGNTSDRLDSLQSRLFDAPEADKTDKTDAPKADAPEAAKPDAPKRPKLDGDQRVKRERMRRYTSGRVTAMPDGAGEQVEVGKIEKDPNRKGKIRAVHSDGTILAGGTREDALRDLADHHNGDATREYKAGRTRKATPAKPDAPKKATPAAAKKDDDSKGKATPKGEDTPDADKPRDAAPAKSSDGKDAPEADAKKADDVDSRLDALDADHGDDAAIKKHVDAARQARKDGDDEKVEHHLGVADALSGARKKKAEKDAEAAQGKDDAKSDDDKPWLAELGPKQRANYNRKRPEYQKAYDDARRDGKTHAQAEQIVKDMHEEHLATLDEDGNPLDAPKATKKDPNPTPAPDTIDTTPKSDEGTTKDGDTPDGEKPVREAGGEVLDDVPADAGRGDEGPEGAVRQPRGAGRGDDRGESAGGDGRGEAGEPGRDVPAAEGSPARGSRRGGAGRAEGSRDAAARGGNRGEADAGDGTSRLGGVDRPKSRKGKKGDRDRSGAPKFRPRGQGDLSPEKPKEKLAANLAAIRLLRKLDAEDRDATPEEQAVLARWGGWGALAKVFDEDVPEYADARAELKKLLGTKEYAAARRNTLNAHYTDAALVQPVWDALEALGFKRGDVLEPGSGSGNFIGHAPDGARMTGVELDPITAALAKYLYPDATIHNESFAHSPFKNDTFDAVIGNVPFSSASLRDPEHNPGRRMPMHTHFISRSIDHLKPGGVAAIITSQWTMDGTDDEARRKLFEKADLIGAVRLPSGSHKTAANTDVVTDVLLFRKRKDGEVPGDDSWLHSNPALDDAGKPVMGIARKGEPPQQQNINDYFVKNRDNMLGSLRSGGYNGHQLDATGNPARQLADRLGTITEKAKREGRTFNAEPGEGRPVRVEKALEGRINVSGEKDGIPTFTRVEDGVEVEHTPRGKAQAKELASLLTLRQQAADLLDMEADPDASDDEIEDARAALNRTYDAYVKAHGPMSRYSISDPDAKGTRRRTNPEQGGFRKDFTAPEVYALEKSYDPEATPEHPKGRAVKSDIFHKRQVFPPKEQLDRVDTPHDAVTLLEERREPVTWKSLADMLDVPEDDARKIGADAVFVDPENPDQLIGKAAYLSDNIREKLAVAEKALEADPGNKDWARNVEALRAEMPADAKPDEVPLQLGSAWMPEDVVRAFANATMGMYGGRGVDVTMDHQGLWKVPTPPISQRRGKDGLERELWGTPDKSFYQLLESVLRQNHHTITIRRKDDEGGTYIDQKASEEARDKALEIAAEWERWVFDTPKAMDMLVRAYSDKFRSRVPRSYTNSPKRELPGKVPDADINLRPHQNDAVTRMVNEPAVLLEHVVGSGKTYTLVAGIMELRRLGLSRKPTYVVPSSLLDQTVKEFKQLYPNAKLLAADGDAVNSANRRRFGALARNNDWDAIIMSREAFEAIPVSRAAHERYLEREMNHLREALASAKDGGDGSASSQKTIKQIEEQVLNAEEALQAALESRKDDGGVTFENIGIDYIAVDEAHGYKNLHFTTRMDGIESPGIVNRAIDMHMKLDLLRENGGDNARIATFASGTPISNSLAEMYTVTRQLRPDLLEEAGISLFDSWAATLARTEGKMELNTAGDGYAMKVRMRGFTDGLGDGMRIWRTFADTKVFEDLPYLSRPKLKGGNRQVHVVPMSDEQARVKATFRHRVDTLPKGRKKPKGSDNHLAIINDGRQNAIAPALMSERGLNAAGLTKDDIDALESPKLDKMADQIADLWTANKDRTYKLNADSDIDSPNKGALHLVMGDSSRESYNMLKERLVARGMDPSRIRIAQDEKDKQKLYADARDGKVDVLFGSTEVLGTGVNIQNRLYSLHHMDAKWKPSDIEQREGRILRQGNQNVDGVEIHVYATENTHDVKTWDMVAYKQAGLDQLRTADYNQRAIEFADDEDPLKNYDAIAGDASGNPLIGERRDLEQNLKRLRKRAARHAQSIELARKKSETLKTGAMVHRDRAEKLRAADASHVDTRGDAFSIEFSGPFGGPGDSLTDRKLAADRIEKKVKSALENDYLPDGPQYAQQVNGSDITIGGIKARLFAYRKDKTRLAEYRFFSPGQREWEQPNLPINPVIVGRDDSGHTALQKLENRVNGLKDAAATEDSLAKLNDDEAANLIQGVERQFAGAQELVDSERQMELLNKLLGDEGKGKPEVEKAMRDEYEDLKGANDRRIKAERARKAAEADARRDARVNEKPTGVPELSEEEKAERARKLAEQVKEGRKKRAEQQAAVRKATDGEKKPSAAKPQQDAITLDPAEVAADAEALSTPEVAGPDVPQADTTPDADVTPENVPDPDDLQIVESVNEGQLPGQVRIGGDDVRSEIGEDFLQQQDMTPKAPKEPVDEPAKQDGPDLFGNDDTAPAASAATPQGDTPADATPERPAADATPDADAAAAPEAPETPDAPKAPKAPAGPKAKRPRKPKERPADVPPTSEDDPFGIGDWNGDALTSNKWAWLSNLGVRFPKGSKEAFATWEAGHLTLMTQDAAKARQEGRDLFRNGLNSSQVAPEDLPEAIDALERLGDYLRQRGETRLTKPIDAFVQGYRDARDGNTLPGTLGKPAAELKKGDVIADPDGHHFEVHDVKNDVDIIAYGKPEKRTIDTANGPQERDITPSRRFGKDADIEVIDPENAHLAPTAAPEPETPATPDVPEAPAPEAPKAKTPRPKKPGKLDQPTFHEQYGTVSGHQLRAYKKHNVPPATHDELVEHYGEDNHAEITAAVTDPENQTPGGMFDSYKWRQRVDPNETSLKPLVPENSGDGQPEKVDGPPRTPVEPNVARPSAEDAPEAGSNGAGDGGDVTPDAPSLPEEPGDDAPSTPDTLADGRPVPEGKRIARVPAGQLVVGDELTNGFKVTGRPNRGLKTPGHKVLVRGFYPGRDEKDYEWNRSTYFNVLRDAQSEGESKPVIRGGVDQFVGKKIIAGPDGEDRHILIGEDGTEKWVPESVWNKHEDLPEVDADGNPKATEPTPTADATPEVDAPTSDDLPDPAEEAVPDPVEVDEAATVEAPEPKAPVSEKESFVRGRIAGEKYDPNPQQGDIYKATVVDGKDVIVEAKAGAGKTSTLEGLARRIAELDPNAKILYAAFNKSVQLEAEGRMPSNVETRTGHSLAWNFVGRELTDKFGKSGMLSNGKDVARYLGIDEDLGDIEPEDQARAIQKAIGQYVLSADDKIEGKHFPQSVRSQLNGAQEARLVAQARRAWEDIKDPNGRLRVTQDDFRKMWALSRPDFTKTGSGNKRRATVLFVDEAQDTPPVLAKVFADQKMQKVIVGDPDQAIYGFAGATDYLSKAEGDVRLPLDKSYRYGPQIADAGNRFLQLLKSKARAIGGGPESKITKDMKDADAVLVRSNGGLLGAIEDELGRGRTVGVPKGTKTELMSLIESAGYLRGERGKPWKGMHPDLEPFNTWAEVKKAAEKGDDPKIAMVARLVDQYGIDGMEDLVSQVTEPADDPLSGVQIDRDDNRLSIGGNTWALNEAVKKVNGRGLGALGFKFRKNESGKGGTWEFPGNRDAQERPLAEVRQMLGADEQAKPDVVISTAHKAKGLEWDRVRIGEDFPQPKVDDDDGSVTFPNDEELRLDYVAVTRAAKELDPGSLDWVYEHTDENGDASKADVDAPSAPASAPKDVTPAAPVSAPDTAPSAPESAPEVDAPSAPEHRAVGDMTPDELEAELTTLDPVKDEARWIDVFTELDGRDLSGNGGLGQRGQSKVKVGDVRGEVHDDNARIVDRGWDDSKGGMAPSEGLHFLPERHRKTLLDGGKIPARVIGKYVPEETTMHVWGMTPDEMSAHGFTHYGIPGAVKLSDRLAEKSSTDIDDPNGVLSRDVADLHDGELDEAVDLVKRLGDDEHLEWLEREQVRRHELSDEDRADEDADRRDRRDADDEADESFDDGETDEPAADTTATDKVNERGNDDSFTPIDGRGKRSTDDHNDADDKNEPHPVEDKTDRELDDHDDKDAARKERERRDALDDDERKKDEDERRRRRRDRRRRNKRRRNRRGKNRPRPRMPHLGKPDTNTNPDKRSADDRTPAAGGASDGSSPAGVPDVAEPIRPTIGDDEPSRVEKALDELDADDPIREDGTLTPASHKDGADMTPDERADEDAAIDEAYGDHAPNMEADDVDQHGVKPDYLPQEQWDDLQSHAAPLRDSGLPIDGWRSGNEYGRPWAAFDVRDAVTGDYLGVSVSTNDKGDGFKVQGVHHEVGAGLRTVKGKDLAKLVDKFAKSPAERERLGMGPIAAKGDLIPDGQEGDPFIVGLAKRTPNGKFVENGKLTRARNLKAGDVIGIGDRQLGEVLAVDEVPYPGRGPRQVMVSLKPSEFESGTPAVIRTSPDQNWGVYSEWEPANAAPDVDVTPEADVTPDVTPDVVDEPRALPAPEDLVVVPDAPASAPNTPAATESAPSLPGANAPEPAQAPEVPDEVSNPFTGQRLPDGLSPEQVRALLLPDPDGNVGPVAVTTEDGQLHIGTPVAHPDGTLRGIEVAPGIVDEFDAADVRTIRPVNVEATAAPEAPAAPAPVAPRTPSNPVDEYGPSADTPIPDGLSTPRDEAPEASAPDPRVVGVDRGRPGNAPERAAGGIRTGSGTDSTPEGGAAETLVDDTDSSGPIEPKPARRQVPGWARRAREAAQERAARRRAQDEAAADSYRRNEEDTPESVDDVAPNTPVEEAYSQVAAYVSPVTLQIGDYARVDGYDVNGAKTSTAGFLMNDPQPVVADVGDGPVDMLAVTVSDEYDGLGLTRTVYVPLDGMPSLAPRPNMDEVPEEGWMLDENRLKVRDNRMPDRIPTDRGGLGLFPGSIVTDRKRSGRVVQTRGQDVTVMWDDSEKQESRAGATLNVVDGGAARPAGWTADGRRVHQLGKPGANGRRSTPGRRGGQRSDGRTVSERESMSESEALAQDLFDRIDKATKQIQRRNLSRRQREQLIRQLAREVLESSDRRRADAARRIAAAYPHRPGLLAQIVTWLKRLATEVVEALVVFWLAAKDGWRDGQTGIATPGRMRESVDHAKQTAGATRAKRGLDRLLEGEEAA